MSLSFPLVLCFFLLCFPLFFCGGRGQLIWSAALSFCFSHSMPSIYLLSAFEATKHVGYHLFWPVL